MSRNTNRRERRRQALERLRIELCNNERISVAHIEQVTEEASAAVPRTNFQTRHPHEGPSETQQNNIVYLTVLPQAHTPNTGSDMTSGEINTLIEREDPQLVKQAHAAPREDIDQLINEMEAKDNGM